MNLKTKNKLSVDAFVSFQIYSIEKPIFEYSYNIVATLNVYMNCIHKGPYLKHFIFFKHTSIVKNAFGFFRCFIYSLVLFTCHIDKY